MQKRHFELIARTIRFRADWQRRNIAEAGQSVDPHGVLIASENKLHALREIASDMRDALARENPRFDADKFMAACGVDPAAFGQPDNQL